MITFAHTNETAVSDLGNSNEINYHRQVFENQPSFVSEEAHSEQIFMQPNVDGLLQYNFKLLV